MIRKTHNLRELQNQISIICKDRGWDANSHERVFLLFIEEVGELAKEIRKHKAGYLDMKPVAHENLSNEFADVLNYLLELANRFDVDLTEAFLSKKAINRTRHWK